MAFRWKNTLTDNDVTPEHLFLNRRQVIGAAAAGLALTGIGASARAETLEPNEWDDITSYNNFYEFGTGKGDPAKHAHMLTTEPWSVKIDGMVDRPGDYAFEDIMKAAQERREKCEHARLASIFKNPPSLRSPSGRRRRPALVDLRPPNDVSLLDVTERIEPVNMTAFSPPAKAKPAASAVGAASNMAAAASGVENCRPASR